VASLVAQQRANVRLDGLVSPLSLFLLCVAESGDRKSSCDKLAQRPVREFERGLLQAYQNDFKTFNDSTELYKRSYREAIADNPDSIRDLVEPSPPLKPEFILEEPTLEAIYKGLFYAQPSQTLTTDEGGIFFGGWAMDSKNAMKTIAGLSKCWDGDPIRRNRAAEGESFVAYNRRLTASLMVQPVIASDLMCNRLFQEQGILARFLTASTKSLAGTRIYKPFDIDADPAYQAFCNRVQTLLTEGYTLDESGGLVLDDIGFDPEAAAWMRKFYDEVESSQGEDQQLAIIKPFASKIAEHARRLAGVMAVYAGKKTIDITTAENAVWLGGYYLQVMHQFADASIGSAEEQQLADFLAYLREKYTGPIESRHLQAGCATRFGIRGSAKKVRALMGKVVDIGAARVTTVDTKGNAAAWELNDAPA
jgi:hypothetical protein